MQMGSRNHCHRRLPLQSLPWLEPSSRLSALKSFNSLIGLCVMTLRFTRTLRTSSNSKQKHKSLKVDKNKTVSDIVCSQIGQLELQEANGLSERLARVSLDNLDRCSELCNCSAVLHSGQEQVYMYSCNLKHALTMSTSPLGEPVLRAIWQSESRATRRARTCRS